MLITQPDSGESWRRSNLALMPVLTPVGSRFGLYYELYDLPPNSKYNTAIEIRKKPTK